MRSDADGICRIGRPRLKSGSADVAMVNAVIKLQFISLTLP